MAHTPHELADEFPDDAALIRTLKTNDAHFAKAAEAHHAVNRTIHRIEAGVEAGGNERLETLKKERLALLDQIAAELERARAR